MTQGGSNSTAGVREGDILAGKYRVERVLGIGGMGVVVAAHHVQLDTKVAIKFLLPDMLRHADAVARFAREARAAVRITGEHVARVLDVGTLETGAPYMVMEYLEGGDLAVWLKERGALPVEQAVEFVLQACVAVADAHALGIVHRDLKPANLFCVRRSDGQLSIKVLDFGISKLTATGASAPEMLVTATAAMMGSPLYMSPEQMESAKHVDARTDIWALGVILYELLTRHTPFEGDTLPAVCMKISSQPPPPLAGSRPDVPPGLQAVIACCLEKDRERRYPNVAELALALLPFAPKRAKASVERISGIIQSAGLSATALSVPPSPDAATSQAPVGTMAPYGVTAAGSVRNRVAAGVIVLVAVLSMAAVISFVMRPSSKAPESGAGTPPITAPAQPPSPTTSQAALATPPTVTEAPPVTTVALASAPTTAATDASTVVRPATTKPTVTAPASVTLAAKTSTAIAAPKNKPSEPANPDPLSSLRPK